VGQQRVRRCLYKGKAAVGLGFRVSPKVFYSKEAKLAQEHEAQGWPAVPLAKSNDECHFATTFTISYLAAQKRRAPVLSEAG